MDDLRTINCLYMCSVFQGIGHPIHVHGEGLCVRGSAEAIVTWDYEMFASEDLVFGHMAVVRGMTWGFVWDYVEITSPFTWQDFLTQRRRWLWGNIHAIRHVLPLRIEHLLVGPVRLRHLHLRRVHASGSCWRSQARCTSIRASCRGWPARVGALARDVRAQRRDQLGGGAAHGIRRLRDVVVAMLLAFVTSAVAIGVQVVALFKGNPHRFEVIQKTDPKEKKPSLATLPEPESTG